MSSKRKNEALDFEILTADIQKKLSGVGCKVTHNDSIYGHDSKTMRQIDVSCISMVGSSEVLIAIECKNYSKRLDVNDIGKIYAMHNDVRANKSVVVSANGYTKNALKLGKSNGMDLLIVADTGEHNWKTDIKVPILFVIRKISCFNFIFSSDTPLRATFPYSYKDIANTILYNSNYKPIGKVWDVFVRSKKISSLGSGYSENVDFIGQETYIYSCENFHSIKFMANIEIEEDFYIHEIPLSKVSGFHDLIKDHLICSNEIEFSVDIQQVIDNSTLVTDITKIKKSPNLICRAFLVPEYEELY